jgi:hypothetical protein
MAILAKSTWTNRKLHQPLCLVEVKFSFGDSEGKPDVRQQNIHGHGPAGEEPQASQDIFID